MRSVILLKPKIALETSSAYAEASFGFDYNGSIDDHVCLAKHLREIADMLEAETLPDPGLI